MNQLYAEVGANPRDTDNYTENNRIFNTTALRKMLDNSGYIVDWILIELADVETKKEEFVWYYS